MPLKKPLVSPVPPFATGNVPLTSDPNATAPADIVPDETLITPDDELKFCPVPVSYTHLTLPTKA